MIKAISLFSGGLDSILAVKIVESLGIKVIPLHIKHPFFPNLDLKVKDELGMEIIEVDISIEFLKILKKPEHGYGKNLNPCLDCKILFYKTAKKYMDRFKADFIITGDVVGQRPFSQRKEAMKQIEREANLEGFVVRPLTQKNLPETIPEKKGLIDRGKLYSINGRKRFSQYELAKKFNIKYIPTPAGGCLLTDKGFSERTKKLMKYGFLTPVNIEIIKHGRLIDLNDKKLIVVGRNESENNLLEALFNMRKEGVIFIETIEPSGPSAIIIGEKETDKNSPIIDKAIRTLFKYMKSKKGIFSVKTETGDFELTNHNNEKKDIDNSDNK